MRPEISVKSITKSTFVLINIKKYDNFGALAIKISPIQFSTQITRLRIRAIQYFQAFAVKKRINRDNWNVF